MNVPKQQAKPVSGDDINWQRYRKNLPAIVTDIALGVLFFVAAKLSDLRTAALVAAGAGLVLVVVQRFVRVDLLGGLALFGIGMLLLSAAFSWVFDSELAVQLKSTFLGLLGTVLFAIDALFGGRYLGKRLSLYIAYDDIDPQRLAWGFALLGAAMAAANTAVALLFSKDTWLWYSLWGDFILAMVLGTLVIQHARRPHMQPS